MARTVTFKLDGLFPMPFLSVVILIGPVTAPAGTEVVICASEFTVKLATVEPNVTPVATVKPDPVSVTVEPTGAAVGENAEITTVTLKFVELLPVPFPLVTEIGAVSAPTGTVAVIWVSESIVKLAAGVAPKLTSVVPVKPDPVTVTSVPGGPDRGVNDVTDGVGGGGGGLPTRVNRAKPDCVTPEID